MGADEPPRTTIPAEGNHELLSNFEVHNQLFSNPPVSPKCSKGKNSNVVEDLKDWPSFVMYFRSGEYMKLCCISKCRANGSSTVVPTPTEGNVYPKDCSVPNSVSSSTLGLLS